MSSIISCKASESEEGMFIVNISCPIIEFYEEDGLRLSEVRTDFFTFKTNAPYEDAELPISLDEFVPDAQFVNSSHFTKNDGTPGVTNWVKIIDAMKYYKANK